MSRAKTVLAVLLLCVAGTPVLLMLRTGTSNAMATVQSADFVCGPRCLQYILNWYDKDEDLIDLVREVQWPDLEAGATMASLDKAMQSRGIHTFPMRVGADARFCWHSPVLLHLLGEGGESGIGHFVVWLPSSDATHANVWAGLAGVQSGSAEALAGRCSGYALLTSGREITDPSSAVERAALSGLDIVALLSIASVATTIALLLMGFLKRRLFHSAF